MPAPAVARQSDRPGGGWFAAPLAQPLLRDEQRQAIPLLTACYGRVGLYLRCADSAPPELSGNMLQQVLRLHRGRQALEGDLRCSDGELPLQRESVDLVYLLHALEECERPHELMLEIERVLAPEGNLLLLMLNPFSPWRLRWSGSGLRTFGSGACRALLRDTGFDVLQQIGVGPVLPWYPARERAVLPIGARRDPWANWRAGVLLQARKRRRGLTPIRPRAASVAFEPGMRPG